MGCGTRGAGRIVGGSKEAQTWQVEFYEVAARDKLVQGGPPRSRLKMASPILGRAGSSRTSNGTKSRPVSHGPARIAASTGRESPRGGFWFVRTTSAKILSITVILRIQFNKLRCYQR